MQFNIAVIISICSIVVMFYCLWLVLSLKSRIPGGIVGRTWRLLITLVSFFTLGYLCTPFFGMLPAELMKLIVALIFFFGAIYVVVTVKLIYRVIEELA
jgi:hypothetical protein